jgi:acyl-CoA thioester hydrolase
MKTYQEYKHVIPIQIRFSDVDRLDHVNNACYLSFFELGRVHYFNQVLNRHVDWNSRGFVLARTEIDHLQPIFLNDEVYCCTRVEKIGNKSLLILNLILKKAGTDWLECARGSGVLVATDYVNKQSIEVPVEWRNLIKDFEKF